MDSNKLEDVANRLGDAVVDPDVWPNLMENLCRAGNAMGALLLQSENRTSNVPMTASVSEIAATYFKNHWHERDIRADRAVPLLKKGASVVLYQDIVTTDDIKFSSFYQECVMPFKIPWFATLGIWSGPSLWGGMSFYRTSRQGMYSQVEKALLVPLARKLSECAALSSAVGQVSLKNVIDALGLVSRPAIAVDRLGFVIGANDDAVTLFGDDFRVNNRALVFSDASSRASFDRFCDQMRTSSEAQALLAAPIIVKRKFLAPIIMRAIPINGACRGPFSGARAILILSDLASASKPNSREMAMIFGLRACLSGFLRVIPSFPGSAQQLPLGAEQRKRCGPKRTGHGMSPSSRL